MRNKGDWSAKAFESRAKAAATRGSVTFEAEERIVQGKGLDSLVDPKQRGVIRQALNLLVPEGDEFVLKYGVAMPVQTDIDTTASMADNVDRAFKVQPKVQNLLVQGQKAVLRRYHTQMATGVVQDRLDSYPFQRSMFEPDNEVERQMGLLYRERQGADSTEDYQIGLFAAAYLADTSITKYGLRGYYFAVGDEIGRDELDDRILEQVFGKGYREKAFGKNASRNLPTTKQVAKVLLENWHAFYLQVGSLRSTTEWWSEVLGQDRVIRLPKTEDLAEVQSVIIGLTEGTLSQKSAESFLFESGVSAREAGRVVEACSGIPIGLQASLPNFEKIPMAGARFASREDIWPIGVAKPRESRKPKASADDALAPKDWKL